MSFTQPRTMSVLRRASSTCVFLRLEHLSEASAPQPTTSASKSNRPNQGSASFIAPARPTIPTPAASQIPFEIHSRECASGFVQTTLSKLPRPSPTTAPGHRRAGAAPIRSKRFSVLIRRDLPEGLGRSRFAAGAWFRWAEHPVYGRRRTGQWVSGMPHAEPALAVAESAPGGPAP